jgi:hypothetical protein
MARAYYSTVFEQTAERIWEVFRDFNSYPRWVDGIDESFIEDGRPGDSVGCVRNFGYEGARIRQRLLALRQGPRLYVRDVRTAPDAGDKLRRHSTRNARGRR